MKTYQSTINGSRRQAIIRALCAAWVKNNQPKVWEAIYEEAAKQFPPKSRIYANSAKNDKFLASIAKRVGK
jgi:hypothetical protein